ncbi:lipoprotein insertase outer membrane protein LolB [Luteimonas sp. JM171]|uniref:lipoprotein insertase outer membrane protein LolB n=1 Tax=Luteimonas sp. JM171 TaxID=1896164 RepID=UPI000855651D|nr:lipoprotein insertase outer membrane protein LolB [Luteimonas sp. JM171]AOH35107.1 outer membrane lipoprotein LolB [Luteimonas sp. JM171]
MRLAARLAALLAVLALAGCVSQPMRAPETVELSGPAYAAAMEALRAREALVEGAGALSFSGRVALSNGEDGGSGRLEWWQAGEDYRVVLRAPVTRQGWSLTAGAGGARIDGLEGGPRVGPDPDWLLLEATGMQVPVGALAAWAAGTRADEAAHGPAHLEFSASGRLARLRQAGWTIDYVSWQERAGEPGPGDAPPLPRRIDAARGDAHVRLVVDDWALGAAAPGGS